jgi:phosphate:Na+ symporter
MTDDARGEILDLHSRVSTYVNFITDRVKEDNKKVLREANKQSRVITHFVKEYRGKHLERVGTEHTSPLKSLIFTDMLNSYRRIKDHALNIAEALTGEK